MSGGVCAAAEWRTERALHEMEVEESERGDVLDDNELRAAGQVCERCGQVITARQDVGGGWAERGNGDWIGRAAVIARRF